MFGFEETRRTFHGGFEGFLVCCSAIHQKTNRKIDKFKKTIFDVKHLLPPLGVKTVGVTKRFDGKTFTPLHPTYIPSLSHNVLEWERRGTLGLNVAENTDNTIKNTSNKNCSELNFLQKKVTGRKPHLPNSGARGLQKHTIFKLYT